MQHHLLHLLGTSLRKRGKHLGQVFIKTRNNRSIASYTTKAIMFSYVSQNKYFCDNYLNPVLVSNIVDIFDDLVVSEVC